MRPYTLFWCGLVSLIGASLSYGDLPLLSTVLLVFIIPMFGWIAGLYLADYFDRGLDAIQKPHRPIPSGRITPHEALIVGAIYAIIGLGLSFLLPIITILFVFLASILVFCYARYTKTRGLLGNLNRGALTAATYLFGVCSLGHISTIPWFVWAVTLVFFFHDTNSNIIGAIRDVQGDGTGGYKTTPVLYGIKNSLLISIFLSSLYILLTIGLIQNSKIISNNLSFFILFILGIIILVAMYLRLFTSLHTLTRKQSLVAHELFVAERIVFASAFIIGIAQSQILALTISGISLLLTILSQHILRERYELT